MLPELDRSSNVPLTEQISNSISALIASDRLRDGARLWSIRKCATTLNVSPTTVSTAYDRLVATGLVEACAARGFFVSGPRPRTAERPRQAPAAGPRPHRATDAGGADPAPWIDAAAQHLPPDWYSERSSMTILRKWLRALDERPARRGGDDGVALRELICIHLAMEGMDVPVADTLLADSHEDALDLILASRQHADGLVVVEEPSGARLLDFLRKRRVPAAAVPRTPQGIDIDALERLCRHSPPKLLFTQPALHDPTGWGSTPANLHALLQLADRHGFLIAEDDTYGDLNPAGQVRIAQLSNLRQVVYYRTFSGYRWPATNVTFIAGEGSRMKTLRTLGEGAIRDRDDGVEALMAELLRSGRYARQMARARERLRIARANALRLLTRAGLHVDGAGAGVFLWAGVPAPTDVRALVDDARAHRIALADGAAFCLGPDAAARTGRRHLRFNAAFSDDVRLFNYLKTTIPRLAGMT